MTATTTTADDPWIKQAEANPHARLRLFCFLYAGAGASVFNNWAKDLSAEVEVLAVQLPGRETRSREALIDRLALLVPALTPVLRPYLDRPFAFYGHSMGSMIAFEVARQLRREHEPTPSRLFVASRRAPQIPLFYPPLHRMDDPELIEKLRQVNQTPESLLKNSKWMRHFLPVLRADLSLCETYAYTPEAPLDCPISAFVGEQDPDITPALMAGWRDHTSRAFSLRVLNGGHFLLHSDRETLLEAIGQDLSPLLAYG